METLVRDLQKESTERAISNEHRLTQMDDKLDQLLDLVKGSIMGRLNNHERRIDALERRRIWMTGWAAGAGAVGALVTTILGRFL